MAYCRITQCISGGKSQKGANSLVNYGTAGNKQLDEVYVPFTMKLVKIMTTWKENPLIFQSVE